MESKEQQIDALYEEIKSYLPAGEDFSGLHYIEIEKCETFHDIIDMVTDAVRNEILFEQYSKDFLMRGTTLNRALSLVDGDCCDLDIFALVRLVKEDDALKYLDAKEEYIKECLDQIAELRKITIDMLLPQEAVQLLDSMDIECCCTRQDNNIVVEMEFYSPKGGDNIHDAWLVHKEVNDDYTEEEYKRDNLKKFCEELDGIYENFDVDGYVEMWLENKDKCPLGAAALVEEAQWIDTFLGELSRDMGKIARMLNEIQ